MFEGHLVLTVGAATGPAGVRVTVGALWGLGAVARKLEEGWRAGPGGSPGSPPRGWAVRERSAAQRGRLRGGAEAGGQRGSRGPGSRGRVQVAAEHCLAVIRLRVNP